MVAGASFTIAVIAIFVVPKEPPKSAEEATVRASGVDWIGAFLFSAGFLLLLVSLSQGGSDRWKATCIITIIIVSGFLLIAFVLWEHHLEENNTKEPLMKVSTFSYKKFSISMIIITLFSAGFINFCLYTAY